MMEKTQTLQDLKWANFMLSRMVELMKTNESFFRLCLHIAFVFGFSYDSEDCFTTEIVVLYSNITSFNND